MVDRNVLITSPIASPGLEYLPFGQTELFSYLAPVGNAFVGLSAFEYDVVEFTFPISMVLEVKREQGDIGHHYADSTTVNSWAVIEIWDYDDTSNPAGQDYGDESHLLFRQLVSMTVEYHNDSVALPNGSVRQKLWLKYSENVELQCCDGARFPDVAQAAYHGVQDVQVLERVRILQNDASNSWNTTAREIGDCAVDNIPIWDREVPGVSWFRSIYLAMERPYVPYRMRLGLKHYLVRLRCSPPAFGTAGGGARVGIQPFARRFWTHEYATNGPTANRSHYGALPKARLVAAENGMCTEWTGRTLEFRTQGSWQSVQTGVDHKFPGSLDYWHVTRGARDFDYRHIPLPDGSGCVGVKPISSPDARLNLATKGFRSSPMRVPGPYSATWPSPPEYLGIRHLTIDNPGVDPIGVDVKTIFTSVNYRCFDWCQDQNGVLCATAVFVDGDRGEVHFKKLKDDGDWPSDEEAVLVESVPAARWSSSINVHCEPNGRIHIALKIQQYSYDGPGVYWTSDRGGVEGSWEQL